jgi:hypothetical protein
VAEPVPDHVEVDASVEHVHGCRMPDDVRRDALALDRGDGLGRDRRVLLEDVVDAEARDRLGLSVQEDPAVGIRRDGRLVEEATQFAGGALPKGADALLSARAAEQDLRRPTELQV